MPAVFLSLLTAANFVLSLKFVMGKITQQL